MPAFPPPDSRPVVDRPPALRVRRANRADGDAITDVFLRAWDEALPQVARLQSDADTRAYLIGLLDKPAYRAWVAEQDDLVVGFLVLREDWVDHLYVRPGWYRRGIGTRLLDVAKHARPNGLRLFCYQCNHRARLFYAARGLQIVRRSDGLGDPEHEPDLEFRWTPAPGDPAGATAPPGGP